MNIFKARVAVHGALTLLFIAMAWFVTLDEPLSRGDRGGIVFCWLLWAGFVHLAVGEGAYLPQKIAKWLEELENE